MYKTDLLHHKNEPVDIFVFFFKILIGNLGGDRILQLTAFRQFLLYLI